MEEQSNEITALPALLKLLMLKGCILTIDAMGCRTAIARTIIEREADYAGQSHLTGDGNVKSLWHDTLSNSRAVVRHLIERRKRAPSDR